MLQFALLAIVMLGLGVYLAPYIQLDLLERQATNLMSQLEAAQVQENTTVYNELLGRLGRCRDKVNRLVCLKSGDVQKDAVKLILKIYQLAPPTAA